MQFEKGIDLYARLESEHSPDLSRRQRLRSIAFDGKSLDSKRKKDKRGMRPAGRFVGECSLCWEPVRSIFLRPTEVGNLQCQLLAGSKLELRWLDRNLKAITFGRQ